MGWSVHRRGTPVADDGHDWINPVASTGNRRAHGQSTPQLRSGGRDWEPLQSIVGTDELANWMWMHCTVCPENGATVHFFKHAWSRRYLRLDGEGRPYSELRGGAPAPLPHCGGGVLLTLLVMATAAYDRGVPASITIPQAARSQCLVEDLPRLVAVLDLVASDFMDMAEALAPVQTP